MRPSFRERDELRDIKITRSYTQYAEGSVLIEFGHTKVICNASVIAGVPRFLKGKNSGWITAEYSMLPRATHERIQRESIRGGGPGGRTLEIQRLIGRSLRSVIDLSLLYDCTIAIDCDVIQADGGTRTASITGSCVALHDAIGFLLKEGQIKKNPFRYLVGSVSVGIYKGLPVLDLDYEEDSHAETDMNIVMTESGKFIEIQGTAEGNPFEIQDLKDMLNLAQEGINTVISFQKKALNLT